MTSTVKWQKKPRVLDLFAGAGGFSLGLHWAGYQTEVAIDHSQAAVETLTGNYSHLGTSVLQKDLFEFLPRELNTVMERSGRSSDFDLIVGGPPCQGWSENPRFI